MIEYELTVKATGKRVHDGDEDSLVPTIARIVRRPTLGFGHLEEAGRPDLMLENIVLAADKPYHRFFSGETVETARERMAKFEET